MKKALIIVVGRIGAGKKTLTHKLAEKMGLGVVQLYDKAADADYLRNFPDDQIMSDEYGACITFDALRKGDFLIASPELAADVRKKAIREFHMVDFCIYTEESLREKRSADPDFTTKNDAEDKRYLDYENNHRYDILIFNNWDVNSAVETMESYAKIVMQYRLEEIARGISCEAPVASVETQPDVQTETPAAPVEEAAQEPAEDTDQSGDTTVTEENSEPSEPELNETPEEEKDLGTSDMPEPVKESAGGVDPGDLDETIEEPDAPIDPSATSVKETVPEPAEDFDLPDETPETEREPDLSFDLESDEEEEPQPDVESPGEENDPGISDEQEPVGDFDLGDLDDSSDEPQSDTLDEAPSDPVEEADSVEELEGDFDLGDLDDSLDEPQPDDTSVEEESVAAAPVEEADPELAGDFDLGGLDDDEPDDEAPAESEQESEQNPDPEPKNDKPCSGNLPGADVVNRLREEYPIGTRVELVKMDDPQAPPVGTRGTVRGVDDIGSLMVAWDNGCGLFVAYGEDIVRKVTEDTPHPEDEDWFEDDDDYVAVLVS